jgi:RimK family alpha-L-glutamate ligase
MKIWALLSNIDDVLEAYGEQVMPKDNSVFEMLIIDYLNIKIENGADIKISYRGEQVDLPDAFWPMLSNTDSFVLENLLLSAGVPSIINMDEVAVARSKIATYQRLAANGVRVPKSSVFFNRPDKAAILKETSFPFVAKPDSGFGGEGVRLIHDEAEFDEYIANLSYGTAYVAQEYIASSRGKDVRVVMLDGEYLYSSMRSATDRNEFRSNVHVGGELLEYTVDDETLKLCKEIAGLFDLPLIGLDLLIGDGEFVIAEINAFPGLFRENMAKAAKVVLGKYLAKRGVR